MNKSQKTKQKNSIKSGDVFLIGGHVLGCGDCQDAEFVKKIIGNRQINAVITDVPYGIAVTESKRGFQPLLKDKVIVNDHLQSDSEYATFTATWIQNIQPYLAKKNIFYVFNSDKMIFALREGMLRTGCYFSQLIIWVKSQPVMGRLDHLPQHELIAYGWIGTHDFKKSQDRSVIFYPKVHKSPLHPTMKPVGLIRRLILNATEVGDTIYDPFLGSGTATVAAEETKRKCIGIEIDPEHCATVIERMEKLFGLKATRV